MIGTAKCHNPVGVELVSVHLPRVARSSQPWALLRNPFGIGFGNEALLGLLMEFFPGKPSLLLIAHILTLTAGYSAAFLTGGFGIYYVCCRWFRALSPARQEALGRAVFSFSQLSVVLVVTGLLLGMFWCEQNRGGYFAGG